MEATKKTSPRVQVLDKIANSDLTAARNEYHFRTPFLVTAMSSMLKDQRDLPMLCLQLNILQVMVPGVLIVYGVNLWQPQLSLLSRNLVGLAYLVIVLVGFLERFVLMLHYSAHRPIFKREALNGMLSWVFAPFFGIPIGVYKLHHVIMHHLENNHDHDISSTERFQRDSLPDFLVYWARFILGIWWDLPHFAYRTKRYHWCRRVAIGLSTYVGGIYLLTYVSLCATMWVFVIPYCLVMSAFAFGNWSQHIFVNPDDKDNNFALTYNCIDVAANQTSFNDGYHVVHHLKAGLHWTEMPKYFHDTREVHYKAGALTFRGVHFNDVGALVMTGQMRKLAKYYVHLGPEDTAPTLEEIEEKFRAWLKPIPPGSSAKKVS
jgi:fatty acid desaturase